MPFLFERNSWEGWYGQFIKDQQRHNCALTDGGMTTPTIRTQTSNNMYCLRLDRMLPIPERVVKS